jgi:hypothetical protein
MAFPGVQEVDFDRYPDAVTLRCDVSGARALAIEAVNTILQSEAGVTAEVEVDLTESQPSHARRRVIFDSLRVAAPEPGRISARAMLVWNDAVYDGQGYGEANPAGELRASAIATIRALESVLRDEATFNLVGVKELRVFDHDFVAVLLNSPRFPDRRLIGISIIGEDRTRAAALAVLNATNRAVGSITEEDTD